MACDKKNETGTCSHYECPFADITSHGQECVDFVYEDDRAYCEAGDGCLDRCEYSYPNTEENMHKVMELFCKRYPPTEHECESVTTPNGHGAFCKICGETLA